MSFETSFEFFGSSTLLDHAYSEYAVFLASFDQEGCFTIYKDPIARRTAAQQANSIIQKYLASTSISEGENAISASYVWPARKGEGFVLVDSIVYGAGYDKRMNPRLLVQVEMPVYMPKCISPLGISDILHGKVQSQGKNPKVYPKGMSGVSARSMYNCVQLYSYFAMLPSLQCVPADQEFYGTIERQHGECLPFNQNGLHRRSVLSFRDDFKRLLAYLSVKQGETSPAPAGLFPHGTFMDYEAEYTVKAGQYEKIVNTSDEEWVTLFHEFIQQLDDRFSWFIMQDGSVLLYTNNPIVCNLRPFYNALLAFVNTGNIPL
ncbi:MAG: hypothetical protein SFX18_13155 [Pirellulales bacterium]|nr:hypothetical protein [Pirellulales bacterium]